MRKKIHSGAVLGVLFSSILCGGTNVCAQENSVPDSTEENNTSSSYVTKDIEVAGEMKDPFGNVMTEQSYYRAGGDVDVIDRDMLEKRHYDQLSDALRQVPGVQIKTPGYRGGEYGYTQTHNIVTINGDDRVVVLVDGRRMDNSVGNVVSGRSTSGSKAVTDINQVTNIDNIEKIEVIKGPGASVYGSDATGGVIKIITRKGGRSIAGVPRSVHRFMESTQL